MLAEKFGAELVCAFVDAARYVVTENPDGSVHSMPIDSDSAEDQEPGFPEEIRLRLASLLEARGISWRTCQLAGNPGHALSRLSDAVDAAYIVVGTRGVTMRGSVRDFFNSSVAVYLTHRQHRPVLVIPVEPTAPGLPLPWEV
jgi:nucleotide-binding universal stress UspA family protein